MLSWSTSYCSMGVFPTGPQAARESWIRWKGWAFTSGGRACADQNHANQPTREQYCSTKPTTRTVHIRTTQVTRGLTCIGSVRFGRDLLPLPFSLNPSLTSNNELCPCTLAPTKCDATCFRRSESSTDARTYLRTSTFRYGEHCHCRPSQMKDMQHLH
jgi:hypothetical protein